MLTKKEIEVLEMLLNTLFLTKIHLNSNETSVATSIISILIMEIEDLLSEEIEQHSVQHAK